MTVFFMSRAGIIEHGLKVSGGRNLMPRSEAIDLLLDLRNASDPSAHEQIDRCINVLGHAEQVRTATFSDMLLDLRD